MNQIRLYRFGVAVAVGWAGRAVGAGPGVPFGPGVTVPEGEGVGVGVGGSGPYFKIL